MKTSKPFCNFSVMAALLLAITLSPPAKAQEPSLLAELVLQIHQLQEEVRQLRGMVEQQAHEIESLKERQREQYLDLDERIDSLRGQAAADVIPSTGNDSTPPRYGPGEQVADADSRPQSRLPLPAVSDPEPIPPAIKQARDEKTDYDRAFDHLKHLRYVEAAEGFKDFLQAHPQSAYAGNAQYWLAESYYATHNYDLALDAFRQLLAAYPDSSKVPDAWLKIGFTFYEMKQWEDAQRILNRVKDEYPDSNLSRLADNRLRTMRLEGHY